MPTAGQAGTGGGTRVDTRWRRARIGTNAVFFVHAALFASWTPHIPAVKAALEISDPTLGLALLGCPAGSVGAMLAAGAVVARRGSATVLRGALACFLLVPLALGLVGSAVGLFVVLAVWGACQGALDLAMNAHAGGVERHYGRSIFASFHAWWSAGAFVGTGLGAVGVGLGVSLSWQLLGLGTLAAAVVLPMTRWALPPQADPSAQRGGGPRFARPTPMLVGLGLIAFCSLLGEGAAADWSAVYLRDTLAVTAGRAGLGYAAFAGAMFLGRLAGDRLIDRIGARGAVRAGTALAALALGAGVAGAHPAAALAGFGGLGMGLSLVVPAVFGASTRVPGTPAAPALALTTTFGWAGYLCGPPLIGLLAGVLSLPVALGMVAGLCLVMAALAGLVPAPAGRRVPMPAV